MNDGGYHDASYHLVTIIYLPTYTTCTPIIAYVYMHAKDAYHNPQFAHKATLFVKRKPDLTCSFPQHLFPWL